MTREEAITVLKAFMENPLFSEVHKAAFNIARHDIKAYQDWNINNLILVNKDNYEPIEQEPTTKNDLGVDAISREQAIEWVDNLRKMDECFGNHKGDYYPLSEVIDRLQNVPSVTPQEPRKGHWKDIPKYKDIAWHCSECGHFTTMKHNFCPNCGCKND